MYCKSSLKYIFCRMKQNLTIHECLMIYRRNKQLVEYYIICCHQSGLWYFCYVINSLYCFHNDSLRGYILYVANLTLTRLQKGHCLFYLAQYMTTSKWAFSHRHHLKRLKIYYFFFKYFLIMIFIFRLCYTNNNTNNKKILYIVTHGLNRKYLLDFGLFE